MNVTAHPRRPSPKDERMPSPPFSRTTLALFAKGFCMGASDVVPGVSGGTMALILGIYEELIQSIKAFDGHVFRLIIRGRLLQALKAVPLGFLIPLGLGILTAIFTLARGLSWLLEHQPVAVWSFFFGLVLASAIVVGRRIEAWHATTVLSLMLTAIGAYLLVGIVPVKTPESLPFIFICGAIAICAMILPGISGSFILVLLGKYHFILAAVGRLDFAVLVVFTAGTATGIMLFVRLLNWLLRHYYQLTMAALTGLMIGSLRKIWPWKSIPAISSGSSGAGLSSLNILPPQFNGEVLFDIGLAIFGGLMVLLLQRLAKQ
jgi:putative membrane protein